MNKSNNARCYWSTEYCYRILGRISSNNNCYWKFDLEYTAIETEGWKPSHVTYGRWYPRYVYTHAPDSWDRGLRGVIGMPQSFPIWLIIFEVALPPAIYEIHNALALSDIPHELSLVFLPVIIHRNIIVCDWPWRRHWGVFHSLSMELISVEVTLVPNPIAVPIKQSMAVHFVVLPVSHIKLSICTTEHTFAWLLQRTRLNILPNKDITSVIPNLIIFWNLQIVCQTKVVLIV